MAFLILYIFCRVLRVLDMDLADLAADDAWTVLCLIHFLDTGTYLFVFLTDKFESVATEAITPRLLSVLILD